MKVEIVGGDSVQQRFRDMSSNIFPALQRKVTAAAIRLQTHVIKDKLSGQVLRYRTNNLRSSIHQDTTIDGTVVTGTVGTNVEYAARHEYGFNGSENVKEHLRTIKMAFGKSLKKPVAATIRAHSRRINYPEHSFLRSALADMHDGMMTDIAEGVKEAIGK